MLRQGVSMRLRTRFYSHSGRVKALKPALIAAASVMVVTSCGSAPTASGTSQSPTVSSAASASPTQAALSCRLPVDRGTGAFLDIPSAPIGTAVFNSADDPTSQVKLPDGEPRVALSYDWAFKTWLPVPFSWVDPDGTRYVYADSQGRVHLVAVPAGSDSVIASAAIWGLYGFTSNGIYAGRRNPTMQPSLLGLWRIPPAGGAAQQLAADGTWLAIGVDAAWSVVQVGPPPTSQVPENSVGSVLERLDLRSGQIGAWYTSTSGRFRVAVLNSIGQPLLVNVDTAQVLVVTSAGAAQAITTGGLPFDLMADSHGIWFTQPMISSLYVVQGTVPQRIGQYGYGGSMLFAGPCR
jgi:hypothetical protein